MATQEISELEHYMIIMEDLEFYRPPSWLVLSDRAKLLATNYVNTMLWEGGPLWPAYEIARSIYYGAQSAVEMNSPRANPAISRDFSNAEARQHRISEARAAGDLITGVLHTAVAQETIPTLTDRALSAEQVAQTKISNHELTIRGAEQRLEIFRDTSARMLASFGPDMKPFRPNRKAVLALAKVANGTVTDATVSLVNAAFRAVFDAKNG